MYVGLDNEQGAGAIPRTEKEIISGCAEAPSEPNAHFILLNHACFHDVPTEKKQNHIAH